MVMYFWNYDALFKLSYEVNLGVNLGVDWVIIEWW